MRPAAVALVAVGGLLSLTLAAMIPPEPVDGGGFKREVVVRGLQFPENVAIVVDCSGSMKGDPYEAATREALAIAAQASDGARAYFFAFNEHLYADPQGWIKLPDEEAVTSAEVFLRGLTPGFGGTDLAGAMAEVLAMQEDPLGVVILTDACPDGGAPATMRAILEANGLRKNPAVIGVLAVEPVPGENDKLGWGVARASGGSYVRLRKRAEAEAPSRTAGPR